MDNHICQFCDKRFAHQSSKSRHIAHFHKQTQIAPANLPQAKFAMSGKRSNSLTDETNLENENETVQSSDGDSDDNEQESVEAWRYIFRCAIEQMKHVGSAQQLLVEPHFTNILLPTIRKVVKKHVTWIDNLKGSEVYDKIEETETNLRIKETFTKQEAEEAAWHKRRFLIRQFLVKNFRDLFEDDSATDSGEEASNQC